MTPLLAFYSGGHPDHRGRFLADIVRQDDDWLERRHDFIQWLFPLMEPSRVVPDAPTLSLADIEAFQADALLQDHMRVALNRMLRFYGLALANGQVEKGLNWPDRKSNWFIAPTHNSLRITRILKSLVLVGLRQEAVALHACLASLCSSVPDCGIPVESQVFWRQASATNG